ncbi:MAG: LysR family transcriptional regulator, partial [Rhodobacteraceae bacterium]|nr:LysR family transcriptional regulator [Paracoccaceae bacterium]
MNATLRHLEFFAALCDKGHFGLAAAACNVSQPALSVKIREFEELLGSPLIDRSARPFSVTPFGADILQRAQDILSQMNALEASARFVRGLEGPFRLGIIPTIAPYLLPGALGLVQQKLPALELQLREAMTDDLLDELQAGALDACILATEVETPDLVQMPLFTDRFYLAMQEQQATELGLKDGHILPKDLEPLKLLLLAEGHCLRGQTAGICQMSSKETLDQVGASSLMTLAGLAASGYGVTLLPQIAVDAQVMQSGLAVMRLAAPEPERVIS